MDIYQVPDCVPGLRFDAMFYAIEEETAMGIAPTIAPFWRDNGKSPNLAVAFLQPDKESDSLSGSISLGGGFRASGHESGHFVRIPGSRPTAAG
jgi:hypothetical protein